MCNLLIRHRLSVLVLASHQVGNHIRAPLLIKPSLPSIFDNIHVDLSHLCVRGVSTSIVRKRSPREQEVDRCEAKIEIMVKDGKLGCKLTTNFLALEGTGSSEKSDFGHGVGYIDNARSTSERRHRGDVVDNFPLDQLDVGLESFLRKTELDEFLLLHEFRVGAVIDNIAAENGSCQGAVYLLGVGILKTTVENEIVAIDTKTACNISTEKNKCEHIAVLEYRQYININIQRGRVLFLDTLQRSRTGPARKL